jgi:hypothetical protein
MSRCSITEERLYRNALLSIIKSSLQNYVDVYMHASDSVKYKVDRRTWWVREVSTGDEYSSRVEEMNRVLLGLFGCLSTNFVLSE